MSTPKPDLDEAESEGEGDPEPKVEPFPLNEFVPKVPRGSPKNRNVKREKVIDDLEANADDVRKESIKENIPDDIVKELFQFSEEER